MKKSVLVFALAMLVLSCKDQTKTAAPLGDNGETMLPVEANKGTGAGAPSLEEAFVQNIQSAHHKKEFLEHPAVAFDLDLNFNGKDRFDARITMLTNSSKTHMDKPDGSSLVFTGDKAYLSPATATDANAHFNMFTWPYFFALPYKLSDSGAKLETTGQKELEGKAHETYKLTFDAGTGDTPDDWYIIYLNEDRTIHAAAYIVTFGKGRAKAEKDPHCIVYGDYSKVQGVPIATSWKFYNWSEAKGLQGEPIGEASLTNMNFTNPGRNLFEQPESSTLIE
ncbi:MAG TPA: hypothetical protein ENH91_04615 [Leeuwenhoekiella sp.]|nr:hypothetical protein [Leeuwenhoekiella sp.]